MIISELCISQLMCTGNFRFKMFPASRLLTPQIRLYLPNLSRFSTNVSYVQGQSPRKNLREYFYYIDHQGMLFLDDARMKNFTSCFKDKEFLVFFFKRLKMNTTDRYSESFPWLSLCGRERNYVRCDDVPIVYTQIVSSENGMERLIHNHAGNALSTEFHPSKVAMSVATGRVYYPCHENTGSVGLIHTKLALQLSDCFHFDNGREAPPTHITWSGEKHALDNSWLPSSHSLTSKCESLS